MLPVGLAFILPSGFDLVVSLCVNIIRFWVIVHLLYFGIKCNRVSKTPGVFGRSLE